MFPSPSPGAVVCIRSTTTIAVVFVQAGHMYKTFAKDSGEAYRREQDSPAAMAATTTTVAATSSPKFVGMHAARCFLGALGGYSGSGWLAAEEYACTVLPTEVRFWPEEISAWCCFVADVEEGVWGVVPRSQAKRRELLEVCGFVTFFPARVEPRRQNVLFAPSRDGEEFSRG